MIDGAYTYQPTRSHARELKLDLDDAANAALILARLPFVVRKLHLRVVAVCVCYSSSRRGLHAIILFREKLSPMLAIILQVMLGSDWRRETFNLVRVRNLRRAPVFWQSRWNTLYSEKMRKPE